MNYSKSKKKIEKRIIKEIEVFNHLLGKYVEVGKKFTSPFRNDKRAGCKIGFYNGHLYFLDGGDLIRNGSNCVKLWSIQKHCTEEQAFVEIIKTKDFSVASTENVISPVIVNDKKTNILPIIKNWSKKGLNWWEKLGVKDLEYVSEIEGYVIDSFPVFLNKLSFVYNYENEYKFYIPKEGNTKSVWLGNVSKEKTIWVHNNYEKLLIAKSFKCQKVIQALLGTDLSYMHHQSELIVKSPHVERIMLYSKIYILLDNDFVGKQNANEFAEKLRKLGADVKVFFTEEEKDISDYYLRFGREKTIKLLKDNIYE